MPCLRPQQVELLLCPGLMTDALGSFLAADRGVALERFLEPIQAHRLSNEALRVLAEEVVLALQQDPSLATTWVPLPAILANVQIFEDLRAQLAEVLLHTDYVSLWTQDEALAAAIIQMASVQVVFSQDTQLAENVWKAVVGIFQRLATRGDPALIAELRKNSPSTKLSLAVQSLFETMLNVANAATQPQEVVRRFGRLILEAVQAWPDLGSVFLPLVSSLCRRLPVELGQEMWPVLVRLRAT